MEPMQEESNNYQILQNSNQNNTLQTNHHNQLQSCTVTRCVTQTKPIQTQKEMQTQTLPMVHSNTSDKTSHDEVSMQCESTVLQQLQKESCNNASCTSEHSQSHANTMNNFHNQQVQWKQSLCTTCHEMWPSRYKTCKHMYECKRCTCDKSTPKKYSQANNMNPGSVPECLQDLTQIEEMLIARASPIMYIYKKQGGQRGYKGHVLNLSQDVQSLLDKLPPNINNLPILVLRRSGTNDTYADFTVRRDKILNALIWLQKNNPFYKSIVIDHINIQQLPENGVPEEIFQINNAVSPTVLQTNTVESQHDINCNESEQTNTMTETNDNNNIDNTYDKDEINMRLDNDDNQDLSEHNYTSFISIPHHKQNEIESIRNVINDKNSPLQWPPLSQTPISEFQTEGLATMAFPTLFPYGTGDPTTKNRQHDVTYTEFLKHLIRFAEIVNNKAVWRFASHPRFPYWALNMKQRHHLLTQANVYLKQNPADATLTVQQLRDMVGKMNSEQLMSRLQRYVSKLQGTKQYWYQRSLELKALVQNKGAPTFFWTVSSADTYWPELHALLPHDTDKPTHPMRIKAVINNPHITDWYFTNRVSDFVKYWLYETLHAEWHWYRFEYQSRGSPHVHGCAKLKNDPDLCHLIKKAALAWKIENSLQSNIDDIPTTVQEQILIEGNIAKQTVIKYCDWLTTTFNNSTPSENWRAPTPENHPAAKNPIDITDTEEDYITLVNTVQRHTRCNAAYCLQKKSGHSQPTCRFDYPRPMQHATDIQFETLLDGRTRARVITKRNDPLINTHNPTMLKHWRANVDLQVIIDIEDCVRYMTKYAAKAEVQSQTAKQIFQTCVTKLTQASQTQSAIRSAMIKSIGERDFSAQETAHMLLGLPLYSCTYTFTTILLDNSRSVVIHPNSSPLQLSTNLSLMDFYAKRVQQTVDTSIQNINLMTFASHFYVHQNKLKKRNKEVIVRTFPNYSSHSQGKNYPQYCKYQLIKYKPWHTQLSNAWNNLPDTDATYITAYHDFLKTVNAQQCLPQLQEELEHIERYLHDHQEIENDITFTQNTLHNDQDDWMLLCQRSMTFQHQSEGENVHSDADDLYWQQSETSLTQQEIIESANWIYLKKKEHPGLLYQMESTAVINISALNNEQRLAYDIVHKHYTHSLNEDTATVIPNALHMIIYGTAGTGKSYLIHAISSLLKESCFLTATTGIAAFNIHGMTIHSLLQLPIRQLRNTELKGSSLIRLQEKLKHKKYIIIDEMSMLGQRGLSWINKRLKQATGHYEQPFGGLSIILIGDFAQLPPVGDKPLYIWPNTQNQDYNDGYLLFRLFNTVVQLKQQMRQNNSTHNFRELLTAIRNGHITQQHWHTLLTRTPTNVSNCREFQNATHLFFDKESVTQHNYKMLQKLGNPIAKIEAINSDNIAAATKSDEAGNLDSIVFLSKNSKVMLTSNLWQQTGLCNGAIGIVKDILYKENQKPPSLPISILVEFNKYKGPAFISEHPLWVPIPPITFEWMTNTIHSRKQIPLRLCYAMTIHKSQGQTLEKAVIDLGNSERTPGLTFVALSRLRRLDDILIKEMTFKRLDSISKSKHIMARINEENRLETIHATLQSTSRTHT